VVTETTTILRLLTIHSLRVLPQFVSVFRKLVSPCLIIWAGNQDSRPGWLYEDKIC